jgi:hypothetical protein
MRKLHLILSRGPRPRRSVCPASVPAAPASPAAVPAAPPIATAVGTLLAAAAIAIIVAGPAGAQGLPADLLACRDIAGADERLACYDRAVDRRADDAGTETAPMTSPEELFGRDPADIQRRMDQAAGREELQQITGEVVELIEITPDRIAVKLDNGQIWRQTVPSRFLLREGQEVEIRRASLGSYLMSRAGSSRSIRVERAD